MVSQAICLETVSPDLPLRLQMCQDADPQVAGGQGQSEPLGQPPFCSEEPFPSPCSSVPALASFSWYAVK